MASMRKRAEQRAAEMLDISAFVEEVLASCREAFLMLAVEDDSEESGRKVGEADDRPE